MNIQVFSQEVRDGLSNSIQNNALACLSIPEVSISPVELSEQILKSIAQANPNQLDLFYIESILASTGWNKNDDVFDRIELFNARSSPIDKPFNYMHQESDIIGHITSAKLVDFNGKVLSNELETLPEDFDSVVGSVIYRRWESEEKQTRINKIIAEIRDWFVSMECIFPHFDYAIITPEGVHKTVARNEDSAFLTKHLRIYGGEGVYQGHRIGRLPRNFIFSGKGLVTRPGNARSYILSANKDREVSTFNTVALAKAGEIFMTYTQEQYDAVLAQVNTAKASLGEIQAKFELVEKTKATLATELEATKETLTATKADLTNLKTEADKAKAELEKIKLESTKAVRLSQLLARDIEEAKAKELVEKFVAVADEVFSALVNAYPAKASDDKDKDDKEKKMKAEKEAADKAAADEAAKAEEAKKAEDAAKALELAKAQQNNTGVVPEGQAKELRAKASAWFVEGFKKGKK
jgi:hypothetical protein